MTDREKLIELVDDAIIAALYKCHAYKECGSCPSDGQGTSCRSPFIADHLLANGMTIQRWIPVTERLPELFKTVLVYDSTGKRIEAAYMTRHKEWVGVVIKNEITHWMPLPEPPKEMK